MARISKLCAKCGGKKPVKLTLVPPLTDAPGTVIRYEATCLACGTVHPPDSTEVVMDATAWGKTAEKSGALAKLAGTAVLLLALALALDTGFLLVLSPGAPAQIVSSPQASPPQASTTITSGTVVLAAAPTVVGGTVLDTSTIKDIASAFVRVTGQASADGAGAVLTVTETDPGGVDVVVGKFLIPDTGGVSKEFTLDSIVPLRSGTMTYRVEGLLGAAVSAGAKFLSLALAVKV